MLPNQKNALVKRGVLQWFSIHRRDLPWRRTDDPYAILVSEIMLQQTQVDRVIPKYNAWLKTFPTVHHLAKAPLRSVLKMWSGLGYNSRGLRLRELARVVVEQYGGKIPSDVEQLEKLPGIGPYTARAVASFAFQLDEPAIDTNIRRVISRIFFGIRSPAPKKLAAVVKIIAPAGGTHTWNAALMDFGALVCQSRRPKCEICPVRQYCSAYPDVLKPKRKSAKKSQRFETTDRFWRGRIIAALVHDGATESKHLYKTLQTLGTISFSRFRKIISDLVSEKIIVKNNSGKILIRR